MLVDPLQFSWFSIRPRSRESFAGFRIKRYWSSVQVASLCWTKKTSLTFVNDDFTTWIQSVIHQHHRIVAKHHIAYGVGLKRNPHFHNPNKTLMKLMAAFLVGTLTVISQLFRVPAQRLCFAHTTKRCLQYRYNIHEQRMRMRMHVSNMCVCMCVWMYVCVYNMYIHVDTCIYIILYIRIHISHT